MLASCNLVTLQLVHHCVLPLCVVVIELCKQCKPVVGVAVWLPVCAQLDHVVCTLWLHMVYFTLYQVMVQVLLRCW